MLAHVNDKEEQAHQLGALLQGRAVVLNLIPWNPVYSPEFDFEAPGHARTDTFQSIIRQYGVHCTVRQEKGQDISGNCEAPTRPTLWRIQKPCQPAYNPEDKYCFAVQEHVGSLWLNTVPAKAVAASVIQTWRTWHQDSKPEVD